MRRPRSVDAVDKGIIEALQANGREPFRRIAATLGVSEATIRARYARLCEDDILQVTGVTNPLGLGFEAQAMVGVRTAGPPDAVADEIARWEEAAYVVVVAGQFDILVELICGRPPRAARRHEPDPRALRRDHDRELPLPRVAEAILRLGSSRCTRRPRRRSNDRSVEGSRLMAVVEPTLPAGSGIAAKGLKSGALGLVSSVVIGVASTAPGYSLAASLGIVVAAVGLYAPAVLWVTFIPMLFIAAGFYFMNKADPDCGTTFSWTTKAFGPWAGWLGGWAALIAQIIVIANLSQIAGEYSFLLVGADSLAASTFWVTVVGVIWIIVMSWICYVGIEASAKTQCFLLAAEIITLFLFAVVALWKVYTSDPAGSINPSLSWLNPLSISSTSALVAGVLAAIFIYWGWDSTVSVNEETEDATRTPGVAAILSTIILVGIYVVVAIAAIAFHGPKFLEDNQLDVLAALGGTSSARRSTSC